MKITALKLLRLINWSLRAVPEEVVQEIFGEGTAGFDVVREELLVDCNSRLVDPMLAASVVHAG